MNITNLQRQMKFGATNFIWIAGLSLACSVLFLFTARPGFVVGLGITMFLDTITHNIAQAYPNSVLQVRLLGLLPDLFICGVFVLCGIFGAKGQRLAFIAGMSLYGLDAILTLVARDFYGFGVHLFFLWFLLSGLKALDKLKKVMPESASPMIFPK